MKYSHSFVVHNDYRSLGLGKKLLTSTFPQQKMIHNVIADVFSSKVKLIRELTDLDVSALVTCICTGKVNPQRLKAIEINEDDPVTITPFQPNLQEKLLAYDFTVHGLYRGTFLSHWIQSDVVFTVVATSGDKVVGFGCMHRNGDNYCLSPVYADDNVIARRLIRELLLKTLDGETVTFSVYKDMSKDVIESLLGDIHTDISHDTQRLYTTDPCLVSYDKLYMLSFYYV